MLEKIEGKRRGWQRLRGLGGLTDSADISLSKLGGIVEDRGTGRAVVHRAAKSRTRLRDRTTTSLYKWKKTGSGEVEQLMQESYIASLWQNQEESESP